MSRRGRGMMSEEFKYELAKDLGFYETVQREGWSGIRTKDAGNMVKRAIQIAEQALSKQQASAQPAQVYGQQPMYAASQQPPAANYANQAAQPMPGTFMVGSQGQQPYGYRPTP